MATKTYPWTINQVGKKGRYTDKFLNPAGPGDGRPTALQIVKDEGRLGTMKDKVFVLTGSSGALGVETGRALAATGGRVFLGVRDLKKGEEACKEFLEPGRVELLQFDSGSFDSVRAAAKTFLSKSSNLNVLVNNAGVMACPESKTGDGFETQLQVNYLGHWLFYKLLEDSLLKSTTPEFNSRVVNVSSAGHQPSTVILNNINLEGEYEPWKAYGNAKTAEIWMTNEIERRYGSKGLHGLSLMPGGIMSDLQRHIPDEQKAEWDKNETVQSFLKNPDQGSATTLFAAIGKDWEGKGGCYLDDCEEAGPVPEGGFLSCGAAPHAFDPEGEKKLWEMTPKLVGLSS